jgi:hypothetical protein
LRGMGFLLHLSRAERPGGIVWLWGLTGPDVGRNDAAGAYCKRGGQATRNGRERGAATGATGPCARPIRSPAGV